MREDCIILMVKCPVHGNVKSRLSKSIGAEKAVDFYRRSGQDILDVISSDRYDVFIGFYPPSHEDCISSWLGKDIPKLQQKGQDLGEKQANLLQQGFELGYSRVCVMISDSPDIPPGNIASSFGKLHDNDCVIGPCPDGGYYIIGFTKKGFSQNLLRNMKWSHKEVAEQVGEKANDMGLSLFMMDSWPDVDDINNLKNLVERNPPGSGPKRTMEFVRGLELH